MDRSLIRGHLPHALKETDLPSLGERYHGKVRDTYASGKRLILVTTDRISAFDHVLRQTIPFKGQVLNRLAAFFFEHTADVMPNHVVSLPDPNVTIAHRCVPLPIEFVVRGYLAGHAWRTYHVGGRKLCGKKLPGGLIQNSQLPRPILTPATKAVVGHDEDITRDQVISRGILTADTYDFLEDRALALFERGSRMALERGLRLVDTKYEFGRMPDGSYVVIDEIHTPDSSRYFHADTYEGLLGQNRPQRQLSKEFVREWLMERDFQGLKDQPLPDLSDTFRVEVASRYIELFQRITDTEFLPEMSLDPNKRIRASLASAAQRPASD